MKINFESLKNLVKRPLPFTKDDQILKLKEEMNQKFDLLLQKFEKPPDTDQLLKDQMNSFDFSPLWDDEPDSQLIKYVPILNAILLLITIIVCLIKK